MSNPKDGKLMPNMAHHRSAPPTKPPTAQPAQFLKPSEINLETTVFFAAVYRSGPTSEAQPTFAQKLIEDAPTEVSPTAHPTTRMTVGGLEWHARELEAQWKETSDADLKLALSVSIDALDAAAAILKCLQSAKGGK